MPATLSVAMIARNEEKNLPRTLEAVKWADEIVIVDSGSVDRTPEIAASFGASTRLIATFAGILNRRQSLSASARGTGFC